MALVRPSLPFNAPTRSLPFDALLAFAPPSTGNANATTPVTLSASGWMMGTPVAGSPSSPITTATQNFVNLGGPLTAAQQGAIQGLPTGSVFGAAGRFQGQWVIQVEAASLASSNEFYQFYLWGSNDAAFGAGNTELLGTFDIAATSALRRFPGKSGRGVCRRRGGRRHCPERQHRRRHAACAAHPRTALLRRRQPGQLDRGSRSRLSVLDLR
jgi:hypothetical protein